MADRQRNFDVPDLGDLPVVDFGFDLPDGSLDSLLPPVPDADDELLAALFAQEFGRPLVSDALKASIVDAVEASAEAPSSASATHAPAGPRHFTVVEGGKAQAPRRRRTASFKLRVSRFAAAAAIALVAVSGGMAYRMPTAYVKVSGPESTIQLGVNLFGVTVSATSDDAATQELLSGVDMNNMGYEDSLRVIAELFGGGGASAVNVEVSSFTDGQRASLEDSSSRVLDMLAGLAPSADAPAPSPKAETPASPSLATSPETKAEAKANAQAEAAEPEAKPSTPLTPSTQEPSSASGSAYVPPAAPDYDAPDAPPVEPDTPETDDEPSTPSTPELPDGPAEDIGNLSDAPAETIGTALDLDELVNPERPTSSAVTEISAIPTPPAPPLESEAVVVTPQSSGVMSVLF